MSRTDLDGEFHIFVYGTLKPGERAFAQFCEPYIIAVQAAIAPGRLYHLPAGYPAMTLEAGWVQGALLTFDNPDAFTQLDAFEDYFPDRPEESHYVRIRHTTYSPNQAPLLEAWVYMMDRLRVDALGGYWLPDGYWSGQRYGPPV